ncbi:hypothetical protein HOG48_00770 [Candidatus Peregrinibacteria bacterium]|jgi:hypothetical protein|nr:hypothetical protein [Candidatus Peregrinibacteria bacterium]
MSKKKIFAGMLVLMLLMGGMSFAFDNSDLQSSIANVLKFDEQVKKKVPRRDLTKGARRVDKKLQIFSHEDLKDFSSKKAVLNNARMVEQAKNDIEGLNLKFEE